MSDASAASRDPRAVVWISLVEPSKEELDSVARQFELQELAQEDTKPQGSHSEVRGARLTFMVSPARYLDDSGTLEIGELDVLLEEGLAITVLRGEGPNFHDVEQGLEEGSYSLAPGGGGHPARAPPSGARRLRLGGRWARRGPRCLGGRRPPRQRQGDEQALRILEGGSQVQAGDPTSRGRPGGPGTSRLAGARIEFGTRHAPGRRAKPRPLDKLEGLEFVGLLQNLFNANPLASVKQSDQTRRISAWAAIIAVPTVIASIYGMNFRYMPELDWSFGYPLALLAMVAIRVVLYVVFKRIGWL